MIDNRKSSCVATIPSFTLVNLYLRMSMLEVPDNAHPPFPPNVIKHKYSSELCSIYNRLGFLSLDSSLDLSLDSLVHGIPIFAP